MSFGNTITLSNGTKLPQVGFGSGWSAKDKTEVAVGCSILLLLCDINMFAIGWKRYTPWLSFSWPCINIRQPDWSRSCSQKGHPFSRQTRRAFCFFQALECFTSSWWSRKGPGRDSVPAWDRVSWSLSCVKLGLPFFLLNLLLLSSHSLACCFHICSRAPFIPGRCCWHYGHVGRYLESDDQPSQVKSKIRWTVSRPLAYFMWCRSEQSEYPISRWSIFKQSSTKPELLLYVPHISSFFFYRLVRENY